MASKRTDIAFNPLESRRYYDPQRKVWTILPPGERELWNGYGRHDATRR